MPVKSMFVGPVTALSLEKMGHQRKTQQLLLGFLFVPPLILIWDLPNKTEVPRWLAANLFAPAILLVWLFTSRQGLVWGRLHFLVTLVLGATLLLSVVHLDTLGVQAALRQQVMLTLFFFFGAAYFSDVSARRSLLQVTAAVGSLIALIGIAQHLSGSNLGLPATSARASLFVNKNYAGAFMGLATPAAFVLLLAAQDKPSRNLHGLPRIFHPLLAFPGSQWMEDVVPRTGRGKAREGLFSRLQAHLPLTPLFVNVPGQHSPEVILAPVAQPRCRTGVDKGKRLREGTGFAGYCARRSRQL